MRRRTRSGIGTSVEDGTGFVRFLDEADIASMAEIELAFDTLIEHGVKGIVVDFSEARFVDSKAIEAVMHGARLARAAGIRVTAAGGSGSVARAIDICGLDHAIRVYASRGEALAAL
jgi:anti-anti-sigma factor